jgi:hypothetical protein
MTHKRTSPPSVHSKIRPSNDGEINVALAAAVFSAKNRGDAALLSTIPTNRRTYSEHQAGDTH